VLDDVRNFVRAYERLAASPDTLRILREDYVERGTPGLLAFQEKFPFTAEDLNEAIRTNPADYDGLAQRLAWLESIQELLVQAGDSLTRLGASGPTLPVYLVVGAHNDVASGSKAGALVSVEVGALRPEKTNLLPLVVHELTHVHQFSTIGRGSRTFSRRTTQERARVCGRAGHERRGPGRSPG
jgi:hypothetical protein